MIDTAEGLQQLIDRAKRAEAVALDTEFVWERTFYPNLGLIQIGLSEEEVYLVDAVALRDLSPLGDLMEDRSVVKVLHDAEQDLTIISRATGVTPQNIFDTQWSSGLVGLTATISLQDLVQQTCGVSLSKGETRTNWLKRPLSNNQLEYAEDDVRYMLRARNWLLKEIDARGRRAWLDSEMARFDDPSLYDDPDPYGQYKRVKGRGVGRLTARQRAFLRELAAWREEEARATNQPRRRVVDDDVLIQLAQRPPKRNERPRIRSLDSQIWATHAPAIWDAIERGRQVPESELPLVPRQPADDERLQVLTSLAQSMVAGECKRADIDPRIIATKAEIRRVVEVMDKDGMEPVRVLEGWRSDFIGTKLTAFLTGIGSIVVSEKDGWPLYQA